MNYALITGSSKGIGKSIAKELAQKKYNLVLVARSTELLAQVAQEIIDTYKVDVKIFVIDLAGNNASQQVFDWCQQQNIIVNILVNNAGYGLNGAIEKYTLPQHLAMMQLNINAVVELTYLFLPQMKLQQQSYILNIASCAAYQSVPWLNIYAATKTFVLSFSRGLHHELKDKNVSVTVICPGATDTDFANRASVTSPKALKLAKQFNMTPAVVAKMAVEGMFAKKTEIVPGLVNKLSVFFAWILPKKMIEKSAAGIYE
jgi:uncharacterized protein